MLRMLDDVLRRLPELEGYAPPIVCYRGQSWPFFESGVIDLSARIERAYGPPPYADRDVVAQAVGATLRSFAHMNIEWRSDKPRRLVLVVADDWDSEAVGAVAQAIMQLLGNPSFDWYHGGERPVDVVLANGLVDGDKRRAITFSGGRAITMRPLPNNPLPRRPSDRLMAAIMNDSHGGLIFIDAIATPWSEVVELLLTLLMTAETRPMARVLLAIQTGHVVDVPLLLEQLQKRHFRQSAAPASAALTLIYAVHGCMGEEEIAWTSIKSLLESTPRPVQYRRHGNSGLYDVQLEHRYAAGLLVRLCNRGAISTSPTSLDSSSGELVQASLRSARPGRWFAECAWRIDWLLNRLLNGWRAPQLMWSPPPPATMDDLVLAQFHRDHMERLQHGTGKEGPLIF